MCDSTDFIKEDGLFVCQECGCKYSTEEAKKLMKEVGEDELHQKVNASNEDVEDDYEDEDEEDEDEENDVPVHTPDSPNKIAVKVTKVGHETYTTRSVSSLSVLLGGEIKPEFVDGPDEVGHIGAAIVLENLAGKTLKYVTVYLAPYNNVGDQVGCTVGQYSVYGIEVTGPIPVGQTWQGYSDGMWYNNSIVSARIHHVHCVYMDGTEEMYDGEEFYSSPMEKAAPGEKFYTLTITRNEVKTTLIGYNLTCVIDSDKRVQLDYMQTVAIPVRCGTHKVDFEFKGQSLVPAKNKTTSDFVVDSDVHLDLTRDAMWGGFKTKIIK